MTRIEYDLLRAEYPDLGLPRWEYMDTRDRERTKRLPVEKRDLLVSTILAIKLAGGSIDEYGNVSR